MSNKPVFVVAIILLLTNIPFVSFSWGAAPPNPMSSDSSQNTAGGTDVLINNADAFNTGFRARSLQQNTSGSGNTAIGANSLGANTIGKINTASGSFALPSNITGNNNTANGDGALNRNSAGSNNTVIGVDTLFLTILEITIRRLERVL